MRFDKFVFVCYLIPVSMYSIISYMVSAVGASLFVSSLIVLFCINQDDGRHSFGRSGGGFLLS